MTAEQPPPTVNDCPTNPDDPPRHACRTWMDSRIDETHRGHTFRNAALFLIALAVAAAIGAGVNDNFARLDRQQHGLEGAVAELKAIDRRTTPFAPFSHRPPVIVDRIPGTSGPAIRPGGIVHLVSTVTNRARRPVMGLVSLSWQAATPAGVPLVGQASTNFSAIPETRPPGTATRTIAIPMPPEVTQLDAALRVHHVAHRWRLIGSVIPLRLNGTTGTRDQFESALIAVVP